MQGYNVSKIVQNKDMMCQGCKNEKSMKYCYQEGSLVCTSCGLVSIMRFVDETAEWRTFGDNQTQGADPRRSGAVLNENLLDGGVGTMAGGRYQIFEQRLQASSDKSFLQGQQKLKDWGHTLGMHTSVIQKSIEIFQKVKTNKKLKGRNMDTILATMIFMATRIEKKPVIISDIENVSNSSKEDIRKCFNIVKRLVPEIVSAHPSYYVETFAGKLDLKFEVSRTSKEIAEKIAELGIVDGKNPKTIAAVSIYIAVKITDGQKIKLREIAQYSDIAENTVKNAYRDIHSRLREIIPDHISDKQLENLPYTFTQ